MENIILVDDSYMNNLSEDERNEAYSRKLKELFEGLSSKFWANWYNSKVFEENLKFSEFKDFVFPVHIEQALKEENLPYEVSYSVFSNKLLDQDTETLEKVLSWETKIIMFDWGSRIAILENKMPQTSIKVKNILN